MRSLAYRPASTNSTHEARTAALSLGLTSNALSQALGTRFEPLGVVLRGQHVADLDLDALAEDLDDLVEAVSVDVFLEDRADRLGLDRFEHLPFGHLMAAHHVQLQLAQRRGVEVAQVADARHGRPLAQADAALPGAGDHRAIVGDAEAGADARLLIDVLRSCGRTMLICSMISRMKYGTSTGNSPSRSMPASCSMISMPVARSSG